MKKSRGRPKSYITIKKERELQQNKPVETKQTKKKKSIDDYKKPEERDVLKHAMASKIIEFPRKMPEENKEAYTKFIFLVCRGKLGNISQFARDFKLNRDTIYQWLTWQHTKDLVDKFIKAMAVNDKALVYEMILDQVPNNAAYARIWQERYEDYIPKTPQSGNITINFNFLQSSEESKKPVKMAEDTDFEEV